jgi:biopolymer transport protein ExbB
MKATVLRNITIACTATFACLVFAQDVKSGEAIVSSGSESQLWRLFLESADIFTGLLLIGSVTGVTMIVMSLLEVRESAFLPQGLAGRCLDLAKNGRMDALNEAVRGNESFLGKVIRASADRMHMDRTAMREAAELVASEESARWFRRIDLLNSIGNLGPLIGLAGTVWGMILAFTSLGEHGGQAGPADLSLGISKALFHTLLGLCLAIPCLLSYSMLRNRIDRLCTRATVAASEVIEQIPSNIAR